MRIVTVLRSGGEFLPKHVRALQRQCEKWAPFADFECLSDVGITGVKTTPLDHTWPAWWSKLELFRPDIQGNFLFMDLDTVLVGSLEAITQVNRLTLLRDFYRDGKKLRAGLGSGLMFLPEDRRDQVWRRFIADPIAVMGTSPKGDQQFLEQVLDKNVATWQQLVPDQVVSYKVHCCKNVLGQKLPVFVGVPPTAKITCFHGQPRPWNTEQFKDLYE